MLDVELLCGHEGCLSTDLWADGLCWPHYRRSRRPAVEPGQRKPLALRNVRTPQCGVDGCPATEIKGRGWCSVHYARWQRTGDPGPPDLLHQGPPPPAGLMRTLRAQPACGPSTAHLFDGELDDEGDETRQARAARHWAAAQLCGSCPARLACAACVTDVVDTAPRLSGGSGVWSGQLTLSAGARPVADPNVKRCTGCDVVLPLSAFPPAVRDGRSSSGWCTPCATAHKREQRAQSGFRQREEVAASARRDRLRRSA